MSPGEDTLPDAARLEQLYRAKAASEIRDAEALSPSTAKSRSSGDELADVLLVKGAPPSGSKARGTVLGTTEGEAAGKALDALGLSPARFAVCSRPAGTFGDPERERLRMLVEAVDPRTIIALDPDAAADLASALGAGRLHAGVPTRVEGRTLLALDGFEASLGDPGLKRRVWQQLQALRVADDNGRR